MQLGPVMAQRNTVVFRSGRAQLSCVASATATKTPKAPKVLKRAPSPFNLYVKEAYGDVKARLVAAKKPAGLAECQVELRATWNSLPDAKKKPYEAEAAKVKEALAAEKAANPQPRKSRAKKADDPAAQLPRPPNAYALFTKATYASMKAQHPTLKVSEIQKLIAAKWKTLPPKEKDVFTAQSKTARDAYTKEKAALLAKAAAAPPAAAAPAVASAAAAAPGAVRRRTRGLTPTTGSDRQKAASAAPVPPKTAAPAAAPQKPAPAKPAVAATPAKPAAATTPAKPVVAAAPPPPAGRRRPPTPRRGH